MADRFAVATGLWSATSTWSATSGGAPGASAPVDGDNANLDNALFTVTVNGSRECYAVVHSAGTLTFQNGSELELYYQYILSGTGLVTTDPAATAVLIFNGPDSGLVSSGDQCEIRAGEDGELSWEIGPNGGPGGAGTTIVLGG